MESNSVGSLRILLLARVFSPRTGGIENYMFNVYSRLASGYDVTVVTPTWVGSKSFDSKLNFRVKRSPRLPFFRDRHGTPLLGMLLFGLKEVFLNRPNQIHCDQAETAIVGRWLAALARVPYLVYAYGMEITDNVRVPLKRWAVRKASAVIVISDFTRTSVLKAWGINWGKLCLVHPGVDVNRFHPNHDPARIKAKYRLDGKKVILTIARLAGSEHKGHDSIIESMPAILKKVPRAVYLIVGDGPDRSRLETLVRKFGLGEQVGFIGAVPEKELPEFYAAGDVFAMPSRIVKSKRGGTLVEGFGIVFLEANACGKPVIGGRVGGIPDAVHHGVTGLLVNPSDKRQLCDAIVTLLQDGELANRLGKAGRARVEQHFQWDIAFHRVAAITKDLARK